MTAKYILAALTGVILTIQLSPLKGQQAYHTDSSPTDQWYETYDGQTLEQQGFIPYGEPYYHPMSPIADIPQSELYDGSADPADHSYPLSIDANSNQSPSSPSSEVSKTKTKSPDKEDTTKENSNEKAKKCSDFAKCDKDLHDNNRNNTDVEVEELAEKIEGLEEEIAALEEQLEMLAEAPSEELLAFSNCLIKGSAFVNYTTLGRHNGTFEAGLNPLFLWRYADNILFEMELEIGLDDGETGIELEFATIDYVYNDWVTFRAGKFLTPLGIVWEKMHPEWINKLPNLPLPYFPEELSLVPKSELGVDIRGAVPLELYFGCDCIPAVFVYDFWLSNGPDELDGELRLGSNFNDNNHNLAYGARLAFRPRPYQEIGISGMRGLWTSDSLVETFTTRHQLHWNALVLDLNWNFNRYCRVMGEYIFTRWCKIFEDEEEEGRLFFKNVTDLGYWVQFSTLFGFLGCEEWNQYEAVVRYSGVDRQSRCWNQHQLTFGFNYYITNKLILKNSLDINRGRHNCHNRYTVQLAYGY